MHNVKFIFFATLLFIGIGITSCTKKEAPQMAPMLSDSSQTTEGENAPFEMKGDTVYVNNQICASSGSWMKKKDLGKWTNKVEYQGTNPKFKGKKLVFNQCCGGCIKRFPGQWKEGSETIMKFHGLE